MYQKRQELSEREKEVLVDLLNTLSDKKLLRKKEEDHYEFTGKETPATIKTHTSEEKYFLEEYDKFQNLIYVYMELYMKYSGDILPDSIRWSRDDMTSVISSSLKEIIPESYKESWTNIYLTLKSDSIQEQPKMEELEVQGRDIRVTNYQVLLNFILLLKSIVEFKKYIELNIRGLNSKELAKELLVNYYFSTSNISKDTTPRAFDIPNLLIESKEAKPRQLLIIENPPEDFSVARDTPPQKDPSFNILILKIETSNIDAFINSTPQMASASGKILTGVWDTPVWKVKIPDEYTFADAIEGTLSWISHTYNYRGEALLRLEEYEQAKRLFDKALEINPHYAEANNNKGIVLLRSGLRDEAEAFFDKALETDPKFAAAYNYKGNVHLRPKEYPEAIRWYDNAIKIDPTYADALNNKGKALLLQGNPEEAEAFFDKALEINPNNKNAYNNKGTIYRDFKKEHLKAIEYYDKALTIDPEFAAALYNKGKALRELKMYDEALSCVRRAFEISPKSSAARTLNSNAENLMREMLKERESGFK